jgi:hypothetical protein
VGLCIVLYVTEVIREINFVYLHIPFFRVSVSLPGSLVRPSASTFEVLSLDRGLETWCLD